MDARVPIDDKGQLANLEPKKNVPTRSAGTRKRRRNRKLTRKFRKVR
jgi:hypothetical protein